MCRVWACSYWRGERKRGNCSLRKEGALWFPHFRLLISLDYWNLGPAQEGPAGIRGHSEYIRKMGKIRAFGVKVVAGIVVSRMCLLVPFLHSPTLPLGQQSWRTEDNNGHWWIWYEKIWLSYKVETFIIGTGVIFLFSKCIWFCLPVKALLFHVLCCLRPVKNGHWGKVALYPVILLHSKTIWGSFEKELLLIILILFSRDIFFPSVLYPYWLLGTVYGVHFSLFSRKV